MSQQDKSVAVVRGSRQTYFFVVVAHDGHAFRRTYWQERSREQHSLLLGIRLTPVRAQFDHVSYRRDTMAPPSQGQDADTARQVHWRDRLHTQGMQHNF